MCDVVEKVNLVLDCVKDKEHTVKIIVLMGTPSADLVSRGQQAGIHILSLQEMEVIWSFINLSFLCFMYFSFLVLSWFFYLFPFCLLVFLLCWLHSKCPCFIEIFLIAPFSAFLPVSFSHHP